jgi:hypothetical protein
LFGDRLFGQCINIIHIVVPDLFSGGSFKPLIPSPFDDVSNGSEGNPGNIFQSYPGSRRSRNKAMIPLRVDPQTSLGLGTLAIHDSKTPNEWPTTIETDIENNQELKISTEIQDID